MSFDRRKRRYEGFQSLALDEEKEFKELKDFKAEPVAARKLRVPVLSPAELKQKAKTFENETLRLLRSGALKPSQSKRDTLLQQAGYTDEEVKSAPAPLLPNEVVYSVAAAKTWTMDKSIQVKLDEEFAKKLQQELYAEFLAEQKRAGSPRR